GTEEMCLHGDCFQNGSLHGSSHEASTVLFQSCNKANDSGLEASRYSRLDQAEQKQ
ncbi:hypothetical protein STEG23_014131, partial [Scotinomys teguina]